MDIFEQIAINLASSLIFAFILWLTRKFWLERFLGGYEIAVESVKVYKDNGKAEKVINKDMKKSKSITILAIRGQSFVSTDKTTGRYPALWEDYNKGLVFILSSIDNKKTFNDRSRILGQTEEEYRLLVISTIESLKMRKSKYPELRCYLHNTEIPFRIIALDECIYVFHYSITNALNPTEIMRYEKGSSAHFAFAKYLESVMESSLPL